MRKSLTLLIFLAMAAFAATAQTITTSQPLNKNVILATIERLSQATKQGGIIYLSGLLHEDEQPVLEKAAEHGYEPRGKKAGNNWICLKLTKTAS